MWRLSILFWILFTVSSLAQNQRIGIIDSYGLERVTEAQLRSALRVQVGDTLPADVPEIEKRLRSIPGVTEAHVATVCCDSDELILFVGIREKGAAGFRYHDPPPTNVSLPREIIEAYRIFETALRYAVAKGDTEDDISQGHSLMVNPAARSAQQKFPRFADNYSETLIGVLRSSSDSEQRAIAAYVLGYSSDKPSIISDLLYAVEDPDQGVRNNATRALGAIAELGSRQPELGIKIPADVFIQMLQSVVWTDRNKALMVLTALTKNRNPVVLRKLREQSISTLAEMARWKSEGHAYPAFLILGRAAEFPESEIQALWQGGKRDSAINKMLDKALDME